MFPKLEVNAVFVTPIDSSETQGNIDNCVITVLDAYMWRNWMPFLESHGSDGGSPVHVSVRLRLDNSNGRATKLSFSAIVLGEDNRAYPVIFPVVSDEHQNVWDGNLARGDNKIVEMLAQEGPYLRVGSKASVELIFINQFDVKASVKTPDLIIDRAD